MIMKCDRCAIVMCMSYHAWRSEWATVDLVLCNFFIIFVLCVFDNKDDWMKVYDNNSLYKIPRLHIMTIFVHTKIPDKHVSILWFTLRTPFLRLQEAGVLVAEPDGKRGLLAGVPGLLPNFMSISVSFFLASSCMQRCV